MHLANGQTMPMLPGPPVQMPSVISVSFVVRTAKPTNILIPPFHLNGCNHRTPRDMWAWTVLVVCGSVPKLFTNLCQCNTEALDKDSSGQLASSQGVDLANLLNG